MTLITVKRVCFGIVVAVLIGLLVADEICLRNISQNLEKAQDVLRPKGWAGRLIPMNIRARIVWHKLCGKVHETYVRTVPEQPSTVPSTTPVAVPPVLPSTESSEHKPAAPSEEKPAAPSEHKPAASSEEKPAAPIEEKPAALSEEKPAALSEEKPAAPSEEKPATHSEEKPATHSENFNDDDAALLARIGPMTTTLPTPRDVCDDKILAIAKPTKKRKRATTTTSPQKKTKS